MISTRKSKITKSGHLFSIILLSLLILTQLSAQTQTIQQDFDGSMSGWTITQGGSGSEGDDNNNVSVTGTTWKVTRPSSIGASLSAPSSPYCIIVGKKDDEIAYDYFFSPRIDDVNSSDEVHVSFKKAIYQAVSTAVGQGSAYIYTLRDINGNGIPEPLDADASGLSAWNGYYASSTWTTTSEDIVTSGNVFIGIRAHIPSGVLNTGNTYLLVDDMEITVTKAVPKITISSPAGGEQWQSGTVQTIKWTAASDIEKVNILYSTDAENSNTIATQVTASSGSYSWTIPNIPSSTCQIFIRNADIYKFDYDISNAFTIVGRELVLVEPIGGERYAVGSTQTVRWNSNNLVSNVGIGFVSETNESTSLTQSTPNDGQFEWVVPNLIGNHTMVIWDVDDYNVRDQSDTAFEIYEGKSITVTSPNGGESWEVGSQQTVTWTSTNVDYVNIYGNFEDGNALIASQIPSSGSYSWTIPDKPGACTIGIYDAGDDSIYDTGDASFTIVSTPRVTIIYPNGGEEFNYGETVKILWSAYRVSAADIDYSTDAGYSWQNIVENVSDTFYVWTVPDISSDNYSIKVTSVENSSVSDLTDNHFSVNEEQPGGIIVLRENDAQGIPVHLDEIVSVSGVVTASNQFGSTGPAFIQDEIAGISLFGSYIDNLQIGDSITIGGTVTQYNGLTEIINLDYSNIQIHRQELDITPKVITISEMLSQEWNGIERYEGLLIQIENVHFVETGTFVGNTNYHITDGTDSLIVRLDPDVTDITGQEIPSGDIAVSGISGQFKSGQPYNSGYQIMPRSWDDIHTGNTLEISDNMNAEEYILKQNYPNPFNPTTIISYNIPDMEIVSIVIYDINGKEITKLVNSRIQSPGHYEIVFNVDDFHISAGIYFIRMQAGDFIETKKMVFMK